MMMMMDNWFFNDMSRECYFSLFLATFYATVAFGCFSHIDQIQTRLLPQRLIISGAPKKKLIELIAVSC